MGETLGNVTIQGRGLRAYCRRHGCWHSAEMDPHDLVSRVGGGADLYGRRLQSAIRCRMCGARGASWIAAPLDVTPHAPSRGPFAPGREPPGGR